MFSKSRLHPGRPRLWAMAALGAFAVAAIPLAALLAREANGPFILSRNGQSFERLQDAVDAIGNGRGTILITPGTYRQCAVQERGRIRFQAAEYGAAIFEGTACEGKAALVLRGEEARVIGLVFSGIAVPDRNGAGIRLERGQLIVSHSWFRDSEQGILTANDVDSLLRIDRSNFSGLGTCEGAGGCAHSVYVGGYGEAIITRSRFEKGTGGHYVKSRAARTVIAENSFDDSSGMGTNYMIDLPNGGAGSIERNWFVQGRDKENYSAFIAIGAEGARNSSDGFTIAENDARFAPGLRRTSSFVADWTGDDLTVRDNALGEGIRHYERR